MITVVPSVGVALQVLCSHVRANAVDIIVSLTPQWTDVFKNIWADSSKTQLPSIQGDAFPDHWMSIALVA